MGARFTFADLVRAPEVNPVNRKARALPILNPLNIYGRVFFFSWFGFMVGFWAWYTFPPLVRNAHNLSLCMHHRRLIDMRTVDGHDQERSGTDNGTSSQLQYCVHLRNVSKSPSCPFEVTILTLHRRLIIRFIAGPLCDQFGPRRVFAGCLLIGSIPIGLAPLVKTASGLYVSRFFIGILGGSFVPCQVWSTGFFDKNIVGTANALTGGWGNAGGGLTYVIMPAVFDSFVAHGHSMDQAWRLTFIVPLIVLIATGVALLLCCPDTPVGKWSERKLLVQENLHAHGINDVAIVPVPGSITEKPVSSNHPLDGHDSKVDDKGKDSAVLELGSSRPNHLAEHEAPLTKEEMVQTARGEVIEKPSPKEILMVALSPQSWTLMLCYACSFGAELAINSILSNYYLANFPGLGQTMASNWASMFAFLNIATRPMGGIIADALYNGSGHNLWLKKGWMHVCGVITGVMLIIIGKIDSKDQSTFTGLIALMAIFLEAGNGANFALVPHVHPHANGIVSGFTGGIGNLGGVIFAIIFRFMGNGSDYAGAFLVIGCIHVGVNVLTSWIPPIPKGQVGGR